MNWLADPDLVLRVLRGVVIALYVPMLPIIWMLIWLKYKHPAVHKRLPKWLQ